MKKFLTLALLMCLAAVGTINAESINEGQAMRIAADFMASHSIQASSLKTAHKSPRFGAPSMSTESAFYVFNSDKAGYVIVAGDDRAPAVLGYSDSGTFDANNLPEAMQAMLESYAEQIEAIAQGEAAAVPVKAGSAISPLVSANWSQNAPYNTLLPYVSGAHARAGCVATAMAQVMHYWKWPTRPTTTIPAYTTKTLGIEMPALSPVTFNWDAMQNSYQTIDTTSTAALAAARLTLYCAQSVKMDFKESSSAATTTYLPYALSTYFGYKASMHSLGRSNFTTQEWTDVIYSELAANRPVIYSGSKASSGHAFICDGYDGNGMFHINWGWNSQSNGYFVLNVLNPDLQGTGSATGGYGYIYSQAIIVGIEPGEGTNEFGMTTTELTMGDRTTTRSGTNYDFRVTLNGIFRNYTSQVIAARFGWGLYDNNGNLIKLLYTTYTTGVNPGSYYNLTNKTVSFGNGITSGTYRILPIHSEYGQDNWRPCVGADNHYIVVTINGNSCTYNGHGSAATPGYTVNNITFDGTMHTNRPIDIAVDLTNNGDARNHLLYMFVNGTFSAAGYVSLETGERGIIPYRYMPTAAGNHTLTFSFNEDGSNPIATRTITVTAMPEANLSATMEVLNITDSSNRIITDNKFSIKLTVTNNGSTTYNEDISVKLFKNTHGTTGTNVQAANQRITLAPGASKTLQFDMDNVVDGWRYFVKTYYYSGSTSPTLTSSTTYTIIFPAAPATIPGDVDDDGKVGISDIPKLINYLLGSITADDIRYDNADMNGDGNVNVADVAAIITYLLSAY